MRPLPLLLAVLIVPAAVLAQAKAPALAGTWTGDEFEIVLEADGSGTIKDGPMSPAEPLRWKAAPGKLTLTEDGEAVTYAMKLDGATMRLSGGDLDEPITLKRGAAVASAKGGAKAAKAEAAIKPGDCASSCRHYLKCAGAADPVLQQQCAMQCLAAGFGADFLGWFQKTDCLTAVAIIAALEQQSRGLQQGQGGGGGSQSKECDGCVWDGSTCAWYSKGNWGTNVAYSGAVITCSSSCCGR